MNEHRVSIFVESFLHVSFSSRDNPVLPSLTCIILPHLLLVSHEFLSVFERRSGIDKAKAVLQYLGIFQLLDKLISYREFWCLKSRESIFKAPCSLIKIQRTVPPQDFFFPVFFNIWSTVYWASTEVARS